MGCPGIVPCACCEEYTVHMERAVSQSAQLRRDQDTLVITGTGVAVLGLWSLVQAALMYVLLDPAEFLSFVGFADSEIARTVIPVFVGVSAFLDLVLNAYVGLSARAEGLGKPKSMAYVVVACLLLAINVAGVVFDAFEVFHSPQPVVGVLVTLVIQITLTYVLGILVAAAIRVKRMTRTEVRRHG